MFIILLQLKQLRELVKQFGDSDPFPKALRDLEECLKVSVSLHFCILAIIIFSCGMICYRVMRSDVAESMMHLNKQTS